MGKIILILMLLILTGILASILATHYVLAFVEYLYKRKCKLHICLWCSCREMCDWHNRKR